MLELKYTSEIEVQQIQKMGSDRTIVAAARVSTKGNECLNTAADIEIAAVINFLMAHRHGTPFEHGAITMYVHAPIFVWREWHRHRIGFSYNEESGRYKTLDPVFYLPKPYRPMMKVDGWKAGRPKFTQAPRETHEKLCDNLKEAYAVAYEAYLKNLELGVDPGLARDCLPVGIYSSCWVTCNPRSMMAFLSLRRHVSTAKFLSYPLYEIELAAIQVEKLLANNWPITHAAFIQHDRVAP